MVNVLTADQLNKIGQQSGYTGGSFLSVGLPAPSSSTIDASTLGKSSTSYTPPPAPTPSTDALNMNTSINSPTPSIEGIVNASLNPTATEQKQQGILDKLASLIGGNKTETTLKKEAEQQAGLPAISNTLNELNTQLEGLNNQATDLQNQSVLIPQSVNQANAGTGATTGGVAPISHAKQVELALKQSQIASQSLSLKSLIYGVQGKYNIAKDAADKAATAQFEQQQKELDFYKAQLDAITPTLTKEEKAQAAIQQAKLAERQQQINNGIEDKKTIIALATAALKNFPNDPQAQYAAQQAIASNDIQKAFELIGQYQTDPQAIQAQILDQKYKQAQISKIYQDMALDKTEREQKLKETAGTIVTDPITGKPTSELKINARTSAQALLDKVKSGTGLSAVGLSRVFGTQYIPGTNGADFTVQFNNLKSLLSLDNIKLLKGQGQVSDAERQLLSDASAKIALSQSEKEFKNSLVDVYVGLGGTATVTLTDPKTGQSQQVTIDANGLQQAKDDGLKITY